MRADEHVEIGFRAAIMVILLLLPVLWTACSTPPLRRLLLASFVPVFLSGYSFAVFPSTMARTISAIRNNVRWLASPGQGYETLQRCHDEALATIATEHSLPEPAGSVDIYNFQQSRLLAHPWEYRQRPIIQSYSA